MQYRKEIDGLRAIAVLPVMLFHAGISGFSGGYIGVDIFFVISGYLITTIILEEKEKNKFSILNFYERRARRILPALSIVLFFTTIIAFILMPADLLKSYSQSLVSVSTFTSNIFFYLTSGYFSTVSDEKPLLHTWSLAVEEQYYLFFPIIITMLWFLGKKYLKLVIILLSFASLFLSQYLSVKQSVDANFYLIFSRAWELFFGSLIAFSALHILSIEKIWRELVSILGLLLIFYSIVFFDKNTPFPSFYTLIPVVGTCIIIIFTDKTTLVGKFLSTKLLVSIGLISYSLYLWHQPLFAFLRLKTLEEPQLYMFLSAIIVTFIFAYLSWRFIEKPFRSKKIFSRSSIFKYSILSITFFSIIGLSGHIYEGFKKRFIENIYENTIKFSPKRNKCHTNGEYYLKPDNACKYFKNNVTWASFGDSHTVEPAYALAKRVSLDNNGLVHLSFSGCPPALLFDVAKNPGCSEWINESLIYLENSTTIKNVLLGFSYSAFLYGGQLEAQGLSKEIYWQSFSELIHRLLKSEKTIYILYPIPRLPMHISKATTPFSIFNDKPIIDLIKTTTSDDYFEKNKFIINKLDSLPYGNNLYAIKPFEILCDGKYCPAVSNGKALYFDDDHLSISGADKLIVNSIIDIHLKQKKH